MNFILTIMIFLDGFLSSVWTYSDANAPAELSMFAFVKLLSKFQESDFHRVFPREPSNTQPPTSEMTFSSCK